MDFSFVNGQPNAASRTVLLVEDDPAVLMLLTDVLESRGHTVLAASDAADGLRVLDCNPEINLLVADVELPRGLNGAQMAEAARVTRPSLPVLLIPGNAETALAPSGHSRVDMQVMSKPFKLKHFADHVAGMMV